MRYRAKIELGGRDSKKVIAALNQWTTKLDPKDSNYEHNMLEALWVHQYHNSVDESLLKKTLRSPDYRARAAATRVLCYWRDRVSDPLALIRSQINDEHPRVRLEAVRACSFFTTPQAAEIAVEALNKPMDNYLQYTLDETMRTRKICKAVALNEVKGRGCVKVAGRDDYAWIESVRTRFREKLEWTGASVLTATKVTEQHLSSGR